MVKRTGWFCLVVAVCLDALAVGAEPPQPATSATAAAVPSQPAKRRSARRKRPLRLKELVIYGAAPEPDKAELSAKRSANPASVTVASYPAEVKRSTTTYGELLRPLTGVTVDNYGQGGVGYGVALRGFDELEHGRDVATFVDGVPQNQTSSIQVNGYTDLNDLNPELVRQVTLTRGPFDVRAGDFNIGGSVNFDTLAAPPSGLTLSGGQFGTVHGDAVYAGGIGPAHGFLSLLADDTQGYRHNENLLRLNTFDKVTVPLFEGVGAFRFQFFNDTFGAPGYINRALVEAGALSPTAAVNPTDGGNRTEENVVFNYREPAAEEPLAVNLYAIHNVFDRYATFSTIPINPLAPGQALSADRRYTLGGNGEKFWRLRLPAGIAADLLAGGGLRSDIANAKQYDTIARVPTQQTVNVNFNIHNPFVYLQTDLKPFAWLKLTGGVRYDEFFFDIHDFITPARVAPDTGAAEPKGGIVVTPLAGADLFANIGEGIRSPSAVFDLPLNPALGVTTVTSEEAGVQYNSPAGPWHFLGSVYTTRLTNEIQENPPPEPPTNLGPSRREGFDSEGGYRVWETPGGVTCAVLASYSALRARLVGNQHGQGSDVPNTPKWSAKYGGELRWPLFGAQASRTIFLYVNQQFVGESELDPAAHQRAGSYSRFNLDAWYSDAHWAVASAFVEITAYPFGRFNETAVEFNSTTVGIAPKSPVTLLGGVHLPLNFLPGRF